MDDITSARWSALSIDASALAAAARAEFESRRHHVLATLRRDGSPRVSGTEVQFHDGDLVIGMMHGSLKAIDLVRDPRCALHAAPTEPMGSGPGGGDIKVAGVADHVTDPDALAAYVAAVQPPPPFQLFRLRLTEVVRTSLHPEGDRLVVERWTPAGGLQRIER
jgi:hypothetical protein